MTADRAKDQKSRLAVIKAGRAFLFLAVLLVFLATAQRILVPRTKDSLSQTFYKGDIEQYDVLFCGNSLMMNALYPMDLWAGDGIAGYNLGSGGQPLIMTSYLLKDSIERFHPQLVVLDTTQLIVDVANQKPAFLHYLTDNMPFFSSVRWVMSEDISRQMEYTMSDRVGFLFPFYAYHSRWKELDKESFTGDPKKYTAGAKIQSKIISEYTEPSEFEHDPETELNPYPLQYMEEIIAFCEEQEVELLLVSVPLCAPREPDSYVKRVNTAYMAEAYAKERGIPYLNLIDQTELLGIDPTHDTTDGYHLNIWGADKYTAYLGTYLQEHYELPDRRGDTAYSALDARYAKYRIRKYKECLDGEISDEDRESLLQMAEAEGVRRDELE